MGTRCIARSGLRQWRPRERRKDESAPRPWLEAPSPNDYPPPDPPRAETQHEEGEAESPRVIIIDM